VTRPLTLLALLAAHFDVAAFHDYAGNATAVAADYRR